MASNHNVDDPADPTSFGVAEESVTTWLAGQGRAGSVVGPLTFTKIAGGSSNITVRVTDTAGTAWALRRPPMGRLLATAHDMSREYRVMSALADSAVPVPSLVGLCEDESVTGVPFYVMHWVDGLVVRDTVTAGEASVETRQAMSKSIVEALAVVHSVDVDAVGLGDLGRRENYIERQLTRWRKQLDGTPGATPSVVEEGFVQLSANIPEQREVCLVHGDLRLDNAIVDQDGSVLAVLDWELTTLGDPLADLGTMLSFWTRPDTGMVPALADPPTMLDGFFDRHEVISTYEAASGRTAHAVDYYQAFATWRLACIIDGVRNRRPNMTQAESASMTTTIEALAANALTMLS